MNASSAKSQTAAAVKDRAISGLASGVPIRLAGQLISLLTFAITARLLSPRDFGLYGLTILISSFLVTIAETVLSNGVVQRELIDERHCEALNFMCLVAGLAATALCIALSPLIEMLFSYDGLSRYISLIALALPFKFMASVRFALLQRNLEFRKVQVANFAGIATSMAATVSFALIGFRVYSLVLGFIFLAIGEFVCASLFERRTIAFRYHRREAAEILAFARPYLLSQIFNYVAVQGYSIVIGRFGNASMLGIFTRVYTLMMVPVNLAGGVGSKIVFASAARLQHDRAALKKVLELSIEVSTLLFIPISIGSALAAGIATELILGAKWSAAKTPMMILFLALFARIGYIIPESILVGIGRVHSSARRQLLYAVATIGFSWAGLHYYGLDGASIGVAASIVVFYASSLWALNDILERGIGYYMSLHLKGLLLSVPGLLGYYVFSKVMPITSPLLNTVALLLYGLLLIATYILVPAKAIATVGAIKHRVMGKLAGALR